MKIKLFSMAVLLATVFETNAQPLKVDINNNNRSLSEGLDPAYTSWNDISGWFPAGANSISGTFGGVTVTFTRTGANGTSLAPGYWKEGVQNSPPDGNPPDYNCDLAGDGIKVDNGDTGAAQIEMRLSGLTPGPHTLLTFHNDWDNHTGYSVAPLNVYVDGSQVLTNVPVTIRVTNSVDAAASYVSLNATAGQDVVVLFAANTESGADKANVWINGFELDTPNSSFKAVKPFPENADEHVDADDKSLLLSWTPSGTAVSHDVYFGTDSNAVKTATHASPEFLGNQIAANCLVTNINSLLTYYWRIDEVHPGPQTTTGDLWMFRPRHLAFPGAEGYGRFARGGRGGVVVHVRNLNDSGPGSLREAIEGDYGPRTVVFDVSGLLTLSDDIVITENTSPITIAGQTSPGKGICIKRQQLALSGARDAVMRFIRVRVGKESGETQNGSGIAGCDHTIMDHCSISWGIDEELSGRSAKNVSFQRSLISEALNVAGHDKYPPGTAHGYAATISGLIGSYHHNLLTHCEGRNWSIGDEFNGSGGTTYNSRMDIFNNVVYNWGGRTTDGTGHNINFVNNYYKPGAASTKHVALTANLSGFDGTQEFYFAGNVMPGYFQVSNQSAGRDSTGTVGYNIWGSAPFFPSYGTIDEVTNAYKKVLSNVGCNEPMIDDHDARVIRETIDGTYTYVGSVSGKPGLPDTTDDVGGWEDYGSEVHPVDWDTDQDGMPDWWEAIKGFNASSPAGDFSESNSDADRDGFTALEDYLNWLAEPHTDCNAGSFVDVDLAALSRGYTNSSPGYTFSNVTGGSVTLVNNRFARFTPNTDTNALAGFDYTVTDNKGYTMTRKINIRVIGTTVAAAPVLGIRNEGGVLKIGLTADSGTSNTVQTATHLGDWLDWTNVKGSGAMQLFPLNELTNQGIRFFRAFSK